MNKDSFKKIKDALYENFDKIIFMFSIFLFAAMFIKVLHFVWGSGTALINSDASSEMVLAAQLNREGLSPISKNWFYSNEIRVFHTPMLYRILLIIFPDNWHFVRFLSVILFLLLLAASTAWLMCAVGHHKYAFWASLACIAPFGRWYGWNVVFHSHYVLHIVVSAVSLALLCQMIQGRHYTKLWKRLASYFILFALSFITGLNGIRQLMIFYIPLFTAIIFLAAKQKKSASSHPATSLKPLLITGFSLCATSSAGYFINLFYLQKHYHFSSLTNTSWSRFELSNVWARISDFICLFGWQEEVPIFSLPGIANAISLLFVGIIVYAALYLISHACLLDEREVLLSGFAITAFLVDLLIYSGTDTYNESYWVPLLPFAFILVFIFLPKFINKQKTMELAFVGYFSFFILLCSFCTVISPMIKSPYVGQVPGSADIQAAAHWLKESGYTKGIASFWYSNVITEFSDGKIEMWTVDKGNTNLTPNCWLQSTEHETLPVGEVFLLLPVNDELPKPFVEYNIYKDDYFVAYGFDDISQYFEILDAWNKEHGE